MRLLSPPAAPRAGGAPPRPAKGYVETSLYYPLVSRLRAPRDAAPEYARAAAIWVYVCAVGGGCVGRFLHKNRGSAQVG